MITVALVFISLFVYVFRVSFSLKFVLFGFFVSFCHAFTAKWQNAFLLPGMCGQWQNAVLLQCIRGKLAKRCPFSVDKREWQKGKPGL
jgi:hypothetical protein